MIQRKIAIPENNNGSPIVKIYDLSDVSPKREIRRKTSFLSRKYPPNKNKKNTENINTTAPPTTNKMLPAIEIRFLVSVISSISNRVVSVPEYFCSIAALSSRFLIYATTLYGVPRE